MVEKKCFAIKDNITGEFEDPFFMKNRQEAIRGLRVAVNSQQKSKISEFAGDLSLYELGNIDMVTGQFTSQVEFVINAIDLKE